MRTLLKHIIGELDIVYENFV